MCDMVYIGSVFMSEFHIGVDKTMINHILESILCIENCLDQQICRKYLYLLCFLSLHKSLYAFVNGSRFNFE